MKQYLELACRLNLLLLLSTWMMSCNRVPDNVNHVLNLSSANKSELEKVISHYEELGDSKKLKAAYFLIANMQDKYFLSGEEANYNEIFNSIQKYRFQKQSVGKNAPYIRAKWDSLVAKFGKPTIDEADIVQDYEVIKADYLIKQIDEAFDWYQKPANRSLTFQQFCEYLLPYRILNEQPQDWRLMLRKEYGPIFNGVSNESRVRIVSHVNTSLEKILKQDLTLWEYPFDISTSNMLRAKCGSCKQVTAHTAMIFRAHGIPVSIDYTPLWGNRPNTHYWNTLLLENGKSFPFEAATVPFRRASFHYRLSKAYRMTYAIQNIDTPEIKSEVPEQLLSKRRLDVTHEYTKCYDLNIGLKKFGPTNHFKSAVICTYAKAEWQPQDWGKINGNHAYFKNMGAGVMYLAMYYNGDNYIPASYPFILDNNGTLKEIRPDLRSQTSIKVTRKYPSWITNIKNINASVGSKIQGASKVDFSDSVTLATITEPSDGYKKIEINSSGRFKYLRFLGPPGKDASIAELEFYGKAGSGVSKLSGLQIGYPKISVENGNPYTNVFDSDPSTYFSGGKESAGWVGIELPRPAQISYVRYCPRSDTNFILIADKYELLMWNGQGWQTLGSQTAKKQELTFNKVPAKALLLLKNLTKGHEERIFTFEKGKQVWW